MAPPAARPARRAVLATASPAPQPVYASAPFTPAPARVRPVGIVLLSILQFLTAAYFILVGIVLLVGAAIGGFFLDRFNMPGWLQSSIALLAAIGAILAFVLGTLVVLLAVGTLCGRAWAWTASLVIGIIFLAGSLLQLVATLAAVVEEVEILPAVVMMLMLTGFQALIVWYLYTPGVKAFFGKSHVRALWQRGAPTA